MATEEQITTLGVTDFRGQKIKFGIKKDDRRRHIYIIGKTGMGKTTLLENLAIQDIQNGNGLCVIDPHGEFADKLLDYVPASRIKDVVYFNPSDTDYPVGFNVMATENQEERYLIASGLMGVFKKIWPDVWSPRMEYILNNTILSLLEMPGMTLLGINRMLGETDYRKEVVKHLKDPVVRAFWINEFAKYSPAFQTEAVAAIQNKAGQFITNPLVRNIVGQIENKINMREIMDEQKILIVNLSKGKIGEDNSSLLGGMIITKLQLAAMSRVDMPEWRRKDFYLYVDEFQNFATESFINILSEARKYRLNLILAHQYIAQLIDKGVNKNTGVRDAIFGNVGTIISFRVGGEDAEFLEKEFFPEFTKLDFVNLPKYKIYLRLMIDGVVSRPFSAETLPPLPKPTKTYRQEIIDLSRKTYGVPRETVDEFIAEWMSIEKLDEKIERAFKQHVTRLYDAICANCQKKTKLIFEPKPGEAVFCRKCYKAKTVSKAKKQSLPKKEQAQDRSKEENQSQALKNLLLEAIKMRENKPNNKT